MKLRANVETNLSMLTDEQLDCFAEDEGLEVGVMLRMAMESNRLDL
jgi:hypothetical protein